MPEIHTFFSPAKINLFLRILNRRSDGFHEIASLFQTIDLKDQLSIQLSDEDHLTCSDPHLSCDSSNLVMQAIDLFRKRSGYALKIKVHLEKIIPMAAGLGGGSSNAATMLWALNQLTGNPFSFQQLQEMGALLGSDVPFFFSSGTAFCTGRGEQVRSCAPLDFSFTLFPFEKGLSSAHVYNALDLKSCSKEAPQELLESFYSGKSKFVNDLQKPAFQSLPELKDYYDQLLKTDLEHLFMTGSGSTLVGIGPDSTISSIQRLDGNWY